jgi:hypothetical protein
MIENRQKFILVGGPFTSDIHYIKNPPKKYVVPMPTNPHYYFAVYIVTREYTRLGERIAIFSHCKKRQQ